VPVARDPADWSLVARARVQERFFSEPRRAFALGLVLLAVVVLVAIVIPAGPLAVDSRWSEAMQDIQTPLLKHLALVFNALGRGLLRGLSLAAVGIVLLIARRWLALAAFAVVEALTPLSSTLLKALVQRERPPDALLHPTGSSFPSGHAAYAGATCVALVVLFTAPGARRVWWWALAIVGIVGMAWSRSYLQVHWLSDVTAGSLLGVGMALVVFGSALRVFAEWQKHRSGRRARLA
jgi:undecaprenyl-diphosphatase